MTKETNKNCPIDYKSLYKQQRDQIELIYNELGWTSIPPTKEMLLDKIKELNKFKKEAEENSESFPVVESLMNDLEEAKSDELRFTTLYVKMRNYVGKIHEEIWKVAGDQLDYNYRGWAGLNSIVWFNGDDIDEYMKEIDWREDKSLHTLKEIMKDAGKAIEQGLMDEKTIKFIERYCIDHQEYEEEFSKGIFDDDYYDEEHIFAYMYSMGQFDECIFRFPIYENDDDSGDYDADLIGSDEVSHYVYVDDFYYIRDIKKCWDMYCIIRDEGNRINDWIDCMNEY